MIDDFKPVIIISAWSRGSTALSGFLHHCGAFTCPPNYLLDQYFNVNVKKHRHLWRCDFFSNVNDILSGNIKLLKLHLFKLY